ncbi:glycosyltransferase [Kozakia baliensis]|uniref:glycosyltransferase n=1 Tax=Kozakia baliensis TaxID=153496 RepID=UPI000A8D91FC|nr:glycosyltransferase [Kozakia baliensis]
MKPSQFSEFETVFRLYQIVFQRAPDSSGMSSSLQWLRNGGTLRALIQSFLNSEEYQLNIHREKQPVFQSFLSKSLQLKQDLADTIEEYLKSDEIRQSPLQLDQTGFDAPPTDVMFYTWWRYQFDRNIKNLKIKKKIPETGDDIEIVVFITNENISYLEKCISSIERQFYTNWKISLIINVDVNRNNKIKLSEIVKTKHKIGLSVFERNTGPNVPKWIMPFNADDELHPAALSLFEAAISIEPKVQLIYADEDYIGEEQQNPKFKLGWQDNVLSLADIGSPLLLRRNLFLSHYNLPSKENIFPIQSIASEISAAQVIHIPAVLAHRRQHPDNSPAVTYTPFAASPKIWPKVSIIIPTKDRPDLLKTCLDALNYRTLYPSIEIILVDNGSTNVDACRILDEASRNNEAIVLRRPGQFNWSFLINSGARVATGEVLVLLNNDIDSFEPSWLQLLVEQVIKPEIGIVGALLLYPDHRIQHGGIRLGEGPHAEHMFLGEFSANENAEKEAPYLSSAVTGACLAIRREVFEAVDGADEEHLPVTWNDIDLCLRIREIGYLVMMVPAARLIHYELATRKPDTDPSQQKTLLKAKKYIRERHGKILRYDSHHNPQILRNRDRVSLSLDYIKNIEKYLPL